jgi:hypothetical protein
LYVLMTGFSFDLVAVLVDAAALQPVDQFQLVGLVGKERAHVVGAYLAVDEGELAADDLAHALLDLLQVLRREGAGLAVLLLAQVEVVVEARVDGRPDGDLGLRVNPQHCLGHHMRGAVANLVQLVFLDRLMVTHDLLLYLVARLSVCASNLLLSLTQRRKVAKMPRQRCFAHGYFAPLRLCVTLFTQCPATRCRPHPTLPAAGRIRWPGRA